MIWWLATGPPTMSSAMGIQWIMIIDRTRGDCNHYEHWHIGTGHHSHHSHWIHDSPSDKHLCPAKMDNTKIQKVTSFIKVCFDYLIQTLNKHSIFHKWIVQVFFSICIYENSTCFCFLNPLCWRKFQGYHSSHESRKGSLLLLSLYVILPTSQDPPKH